MTGRAIPGRSIPTRTGKWSTSRSRRRSNRSLAGSGRASISISTFATGPPTRSVPGIEVVRTLEAHGVAFTGATSEFYEPSREAMKLACRAEGIDTPAYVLARCEADVERAAEVLRFPLFVKHYSSYSSVDLSRRSRVCRRPVCASRRARSCGVTARR